MPGEKQSIIRTAKGIYSQFNRFEVPPGALLKATNCVIDRPGVIEKRRGFNVYGDPLQYHEAYYQGSFLMQYNHHLLVLDGTTLKYDDDNLGGDGAWTDYTGEYGQPMGGYGTNAYDYAMAGVEVGQSLFFITNDGMYKIDEITNNPMPAGIPAGLDIDVTGTGNGMGIHPLDSCVGYRVVWGRTDYNEVDCLGAPSQPDYLVNAKSGPHNWTASGSSPWTISVSHTLHGFATNDTVRIDDSTDPGMDGPRQITVDDPGTYHFTQTTDPGAASGTLKDGKDLNAIIEATIPTGIYEGDWYEIYRSDPSVSATVLAPERLRLVVRKDVTATDITNRYVTYTDEKATTGADLYTNPLLETMAKPNDVPPRGATIASWKGHLWMGNTVQTNEKNIQLLTTDDIIDNTDYIRISVGSTIYLYYFSAAEDIANRKFKRFTLANAMAENIRETMKSFCKVVNRDPNNHMYSAQYISGADDDPGIVRVFKRSYYDPNWKTYPNAGYVEFIFRTTANCSEKFMPPIPTSGNSYASSDMSRTNALFHSKYEKPTAWPFTNYDLIGSANSQITALIPTRDALIVATDNGYYMVQGQTDGASGSSFIIQPLDLSLRLMAPKTAVLLDGACYACTLQGVVRTTEAGSKIMSWPIDSDLAQLAASDDFNINACAIAYESDKKYLLATIAANGDTQPSVVWCFNYITESWTKWEKPISHGLVLQTESGHDRLYTIYRYDDYVHQERKSLSRSEQDFSDENYALLDNITGTTTWNGETVTTLTVHWDKAFPIEPGWMVMIADEVYEEVVLVREYVVAAEDLGDGHFLLTLPRLYTLYFVGDPYFIVATRPIVMEAHWMPDSAGNAASMKQWSEGQIYMERNGGWHQIGFCSDVKTNPEWSDVIEIPKGLGFGESEWGNAPWGDPSVGASDPIRAWVPQDHQHCRAMRLCYKSGYAKDKVSILQVALNVRPYSTRTQREPR